MRRLGEETKSHALHFTVEFSCAVECIASAGHRQITPAILLSLSSNLTLGLAGVWPPRCEAGSPRQSSKTNAYIESQPSKHGAAWLAFHTSGASTNYALELTENEVSSQAGSFQTIFLTKVVPYNRKKMNGKQIESWYEKKQILTCNQEGKNIWSR